MAKIYNLARVTSATTGTGTLTLGSAVSSRHLSFAGAGVANGELVTYSIIDTANTEIGEGTYTSGTLSRDTVFASTNGGAKISCSGSQHVIITAAAEDFGMRKISSQTTTGTAASITFSSIPQVYKDLKVSFQGRLATAATSDLLLMRLNGDTGSNYNNQRQVANGNSNTATENLGETSARISDITATTGTANYCGEADIFINNYTGATFCKNWKASSILGIADTTGNTNVQHRGGLWKATPAAVTSLTLLTSSGGGFVDGCVATLYGLG